MRADELRRASCYSRPTHANGDTMVRILAALGAAAILFGCGLKGPLYLPEDKAAGKQPAKPSTPPPTAVRPL